MNKKYLAQAIVCGAMSVITLTACGKTEPAEPAASVVMTQEPTELDKLRTAENVTSEFVTAESAGFDKSGYGGANLSLTRVKMPPNLRSDKFITNQPSLIYVEAGEVSVVAIRDGKAGAEYQLGSGESVGDSLGGVKYFVSGDSGAIVLLFFAGREGEEPTRQTEVTGAGSDSGDGDDEPAPLGTADADTTAATAAETTVTTAVTTTAYANFNMR
ncbi:hypothetical protein FACS1894120_4680 [Clostridia bacterium]|nr:hypothetical protein FACS1894120_4680 [Clostridia bacterium]